MLDILEIAREKGIHEGKAIGLDEGKVLGQQDMVVEALLDRFNLVVPSLSERIRKIHNSDALRGLMRYALKCQDVQEFETVLEQMSPVPHA